MFHKWNKESDCDFKKKFTSPVHRINHTKSQKKPQISKQKKQFNIQHRLDFSFA